MNKTYKYIGQSKKDHRKDMEMIKTSLWLTDNDNFIIKQKSDYLSMLWVEGIEDLDSSNKDIVIYQYWKEEMTLKIKNPNGWIIQQKIVMNKFKIFINGRTIDNEEYCRELTESGKIDFKKFELSPWLNINTWEPEIMKIKETEGYFPLFVWEQSSGKGIWMRVISYQLAHSPFTEFIVVDKGWDFWMIYNTKRCIFHLDFSEITANTYRHWNFFTSLNMYASQKAKLFQKVKEMTGQECQDYKSYLSLYMEDMEKNGGKTNLPVIPYTVVLYDEIETQRLQYWEIWWDVKIFDSNILWFLNICRYAGFKMVWGTQSAQIDATWTGVKNMRFHLYKNKYAWPFAMSLSWNKFDVNIVTSASYKKSFSFTKGEGEYLKPPFCNPPEEIKKKWDEAIGMYFNAQIGKFIEDGEIYYEPKKYTSIGEFASWIFEQNKSIWVEFDEKRDSVILAGFEDLFLEFGFTLDEINHLKKQDAFFLFASLAFLFYRGFKNDHLWDVKWFAISNSGIDFWGNKIDEAIFRSIKNIPKEKESLLRTKVLGQCHNNNEDSEDDFDNFYKIFWGLMHDWYINDYGKKQISVKRINSTKPEIVKVEKIEEVTTEIIVSNELKNDDLENNSESIENLNIKNTNNSTETIDNEEIEEIIEDEKESVIEENIIDTKQDNDEQIIPEKTKITTITPSLWNPLWFDLFNIALEKWKEMWGKKDLNDKSEEV